MHHTALHYPSHEFHTIGSKIDKCHFTTDRIVFIAHGILPKIDALKIQIIDFSFSLSRTAYITYLIISSSHTSAVKHTLFSPLSFPHEVNSHFIDTDFHYYTILIFFAKESISLLLSYLLLRFCSFLHRVYDTYQRYSTFFTLFLALIFTNSLRRSLASFPSTHHLFDIEGPIWLGHFDMFCFFSICQNDKPRFSKFHSFRLYSLFLYQAGFSHQDALPLFRLRWYIVFIVLTATFRAFSLAYSLPRYFSW